ncbi:MAG: endonuclease MutS2 [Candidatus Magnetoovum sp. WYHC-5]|nr:endonuclease MutS2 [Candidatus Magnetoovum sp. WYHC-5]
MTRAKTLELLEFAKILKIPAAFACTAKGKAIVESSGPLQGVEQIKTKIETITECRNFFTEKKRPYVENIDDLARIFKRLKPEGAVLDASEVLSIQPLLISALNLQTFINFEVYPLLSTMFAAIETHPQIKSEIERTFDREGKIADEASGALFQIRRGIKAFEGRLRASLDNIIKRKSLKPHIQDSYYTERNGRFVIPLKRSSKGQVPGVLHDISNSGETIFIEPFETQTIGNELETLKAEEKLEIYRILQKLSQTLRKALPSIEEDYRIVCEYDALNAIAHFAVLADMHPPSISDSMEIRIYKGRHPLLWKRFANFDANNISLQNTAIVTKGLIPLDFELGGKHRCMVISGSNAGGKTVALKTIGVLHLMALSGMHIPASPDSVIAFLEDILVDIGDEQSIEENLSTFSAHITHMADILQKSAKNTLVLIDELGTGTDPEEGGALACSILTEIISKGALCTATTHLSSLKVFAHTKDGFINGSMEMDTVDTYGKITFKPSYKLNVGQPGQSHAFEIARTLGLPENIIEGAKLLLSGEGMKMESLLTSLRQRQQQYEQEIEETKRIKAEVAYLKQYFNDELAYIKKSKKQSLLRAYESAEDMVKKAKREVITFLEELKRADKERAIQIAKDMEHNLSDIKKKKAAITADDSKPLEDPQPGKNAFIKSLKLDGTIFTINEKKGKCTVLVQGREVEVSLAELSAPSGDSVKEKVFKRLKSAGIEIDRSVENAIPMELRLLGKRVDQALSMLEKYLNDAVMEQYKTVKIIHGIGTGILANAVRQYLSSHPLVQGFQKGSPEEGGDGVTVVQF